METGDGRRMARILGYAGLVPFYLSALAVILAIDTAFALLALNLLLGYGAVIASFLGAVYWGLALQGSRPAVPLFVRSVLPGLAGWGIVVVFSVQILPAWLLIVLSIALFAALYLQDRRAVRSGLLPGWYGALRGPLTGFVIGAYGISLTRFIYVPVG